MNNQLAFILVGTGRRVKCQILYVTNEPISD